MYAGPHMDAQTASPACDDTLSTMSVVGLSGKNCPADAVPPKRWKYGGRRISLLAAAVVAAVTLPQVASAQRLNVKPSMSNGSLSRGKHCLGEQRQKLTLEHYMAGSINPLGIENQLRVSVCTPLIEKPGLLFDFSNVDAGFVNYISPTHIHGGFFANVSPLSILTLKAEVTSFYIWPIPLQGAGFIRVGDYNDFTLAKLSPAVGSPEAATSMYGIRTLLGAALQGSVPLGKKLDILVYNGFSAEFWRVNSDSYYYAARRDAILKGSGDWALSNTTVLALAINVNANHTVRVGATNDLVYVPGSGYLGNVTAGLVSYGVKNLRNLAKAFALFLRVGTFTSHAFRQGITLAAGLDVTYELASRPTRRVRELEEAEAAAAAATPVEAQAATPTTDASPAAVVPAPATPTTAPATETR
jgi:hypothetical protein